MEIQSIAAFVIVLLAAAYVARSVWLQVAVVLRSGTGSVSPCEGCECTSKAASGASALAATSRPAAAALPTHIEAMLAIRRAQPRDDNSAH